MFLTYPTAIPQCFPATWAAGLKRETPTIVMAGAIVNGVTKRKNNPTIPFNTAIRIFPLYSNHFEDFV